MLLRNRVPFQIIDRKIRNGGAPLAAFRTSIGSSRAAHLRASRVLASSPDRKLTRNHADRSSVFPLRYWMDDVTANSTPPKHEEMKICRNRAYDGLRSCRYNAVLCSLLENSKQHVLPRNLATPLLISSSYASLRSAIWIAARD